MEGNQSMVRDDYAMGVATKIVEYVLGAAERWFGVDDPMFAEKRSELISGSSLSRATTSVW